MYVASSTALQARVGPTGLLLFSPDGRALFDAPLIVGWIDATGRELPLAFGDPDLLDGRMQVPLRGDDVEGRLELCADGPDLVATMSLRADTVDVAGSFLQVSVPVPHDLQLPAISGLRFTDEHRFMAEFLFDWPNLWNAAMLVAGLPAGGGAMVHVEDPDERPKGLHLLRADDSIRLALRTEQQAPFAGSR